MNNCDVVDMPSFDVIDDSLTDFERIARHITVDENFGIIIPYARPTWLPHIGRELADEIATWDILNDTAPWRHHD